MATPKIQIKRGAYSAISTYVPSLGEPVFDTTNGYLYIGDGTHSISKLTPINQEHTIYYGS